MFQTLKLLPLCVEKPLFMNSSIVPHVQGVWFSLVRFLLHPLGYMKQVPFESTGIRLPNKQKLSVYTRQGVRYTLWYADRKIAVDECMCKVNSNITHASMYLSHSKIKP